MKTTMMPICKCLACDATLGAATGVRSESKPVSGDITICLTCGHLMAFAEDLRVRELTGEEAYAIAGNPDVLHIQAARGAVMKRRSA